MTESAGNPAILTRSDCPPVRPVSGVTVTTGTARRAVAAGPALAVPHPAISASPATIIKHARIPMAASIRPVPIPMTEVKASQLRSSQELRVQPDCQYSGSRAHEEQPVGVGDRQGI